MSAACGFAVLACPGSLVTVRRWPVVPVPGLAGFESSFEHRRFASLASIGTVGQLVQVSRKADIPRECWPQYPD